MADLDELSRKLERFLAKRLTGAKCVSVTDCERLTGGYGCVTTRFTASVDGEARQFIARAAVPAGQAAVISTDRMEEWRLLSALTKLGTVPMPNALYADENGTELGAETILLEFAEGGSFLTKLRSTEEGERPAQARAMCDLIADIHTTALSVLPQSMERPKDWNSYIDGLIEAWRRTETKLRNSYPMLRYIAAWLDKNRPPATPLTLVHGDFQTSNLVYDGKGRLLAIDWEFAHIGDPREDLGWCQLLESVLPPVLMGIDAPGFCQRYCGRSGLGAEIVNPLTVGYFSILPAIRVFEQVLNQQQAFVEGTNSGVQPAYTIGMIITAFDGWFKATQQIEAATQTVQGSP